MFESIPIHRRNQGIICASVAVGANLKLIARMYSLTEAEIVRAARRDRSFARRLDRARGWLRRLAPEARTVLGSKSWQKATRKRAASDAELAELLAESPRPF